MKEKTKISLNVDNELLSKVHEIMDASPIDSLSYHVISLIKDGIELREKVKRQDRMLELVALKNLHMMRQLVVTRGPDVLKQMDEQFQEKLPELNDLILGNGIDYEGT
ncbi:hypothetical protein Q672_10750 [Marinobacter sp. EVN1]|uniref:hypothetical protein n=1 Tax=Marinobacter sp. EVN1 TaxID=1397532 RepID=UPI0003B8C072|nr:hypothetical protein [Marinobacter sp. EVN1]ERS88327.1 hypothetical protein Q672_10750 [Marinobacter sp. EVN1]